MRRNLWIGWLILQAALVAALAIGLGSRWMPLGVRGEWEWLRIDLRPEILSVVIACLFVFGYALYAVTGLTRIAKGRPATAWLIGLVPAAILVQAAIQDGAPHGYGLIKSSVALLCTGSSGYYAVAKDQIGDLGPFLADYPTWIKGQDALHVGTHPPGLFVVARCLLHLMETHPEWAKRIVRVLPKTFEITLQAASASGPLPFTDRASLAITGLLTLIACSLTVVPLFWLARSRLSASASWVAACLWPMVPAALMFQPTADTAFPLLSTAALAAAVGASRRPSMAIVAGLLLGIGTGFTLAFFPVGLVVAIVYLSESNLGWRSKIPLLALTGVGFLAVTLGFWLLTTANPFSIWQSNAANHARFYQQNPRSYLAWLVVNPIELTIAIGLPTAVWAVAGVRRAPTVSLATIVVLFLLTVSGKNLSEVARLWLPMMPPLLLLAGAGFERFAARPWAIGATIALLGAETLILEAMIQVVYPVSPRNSMDLIYRFDPFLPLQGRRVDTAAEATRLLREGNDLFVSIADRVRDHFQGRGDESAASLIVPFDPMTFGISMVQGTPAIQAPFALVLGCSDARAPVELIFQQTCNDVFVVRVAGNVLGVECLGSIDYAARNLGESLRLVVVLGHTGCGAVTAAVNMYMDPHDYPALDLSHSLRSLVDRIMIAVRGSAKALERAAGTDVVKAPGYRAALLEISLYMNAALTAFDLRRELKSRGDGPEIEVVYGVFDIISQRVRSMPDGVQKTDEVSTFEVAPLYVNEFERLSADLVRSVVARGMLYRSQGS